MVVATMSSKGQVTVPREVREELGLVTGSRVAFDILADGRVVIELARPRSVMTLAGVLRHDVTPPMTVEEMDAAIMAGVLGES